MSSFSDRYKCLSHRSYRLPVKLKVCLDNHNRIVAMFEMRLCFASGKAFRRTVLIRRWTLMYLPHLDWCASSSGHTSHELRLLHKGTTGWDMCGISVISDSSGTIWKLGRSCCWTKKDGDWRSEICPVWPCSTSSVFIAFLEYNGKILVLTLK